MDKILILDFGSQYTQLIARRLREINVFCEIKPYNTNLSLEPNLKAIILSGSPFSVLDEHALQVDLSLFIGKIPVLAICYGAQYIALASGGEVQKSDKREYGKATIQIQDDADPLFKGIKGNSVVWMSHGDSIIKLPDGYQLLANTADIPVAAYKRNSNVGAPVYCLQYHLEVTHTQDGAKMLENFVKHIAHCEQEWTPQSFIENTVLDLKSKIGEDRVILGLSGGVDSSVASILLHKAIGDQLTCIFVNNGLLRLDEFDQVLNDYQALGLNIIGVDATDDFISALKGVSDPEQKRKIIGRVFIEVFDREAKRIEHVKYLAQGTIYPDVIESVSVHGPSVTIKSHHNVGGLPEKLNLKIVEPLRMLFKDEVRKVGKAMGMPPILVNRHPFPGPGLAIRILGDITAEKVEILQKADAIFINHLRKSGWYDKVWQAGTILLPVKSVGVMGDERTYEATVALRCVNSRDGMTADWSFLPHDLLADISSDIINKVKGINRVVYDISTKPPATIEWE